MESVGQVAACDVVETSAPILGQLDHAFKSLSTGRDLLADAQDGGVGIACDQCQREMRIASGDCSRP